MNLDSFTRKYKLAKTLRFELRPIGKTLQTFREKFLPGDKRRDVAYPGVKELLDDQHKALLERTLSNPPPLDWERLARAYGEYRSSDKSKEAKDALAAEQATFRKALAAHFRSDEAFALLTAPTPQKLFKSLQDEYARNNEPLPDDLSTFLRFSCYFKGYQENRRNIYSDEPQATAAANRAVNENFQKFLEDIHIVRHISEKYPEILADAERELSSLLKGKPLASLFEPAAYGGFLAQSHIDFFNSVLGGFVPAEGEKTRGINEFINLYLPQHEEARADRALVPLRPLYKQILSDRESHSLVPRKFEKDKDKDVLSAIRDMLEGQFLALHHQKVVVNVPDALQSLLATLSSSPAIWVDGAEISRVSKDLLGSWDALSALMESAAEARFASESTERKRLDAIGKWLKKPVFSLAELGNLREETDTGTTIVNVSELWKGPVAAERFAAVRNAVAEVLPALASAKSDTETPLRERKELVAKIKGALDAILDLLHFVKPLHAGEGLDRDNAFYGTFDMLYDALDGFVPLYNKVRNYLTRKPGETERVKLMFENPSFLEGWEQNLETKRTCVLFIRDGLYYLGVMDPSAKTDFSKLAAPETPGCYRKMDYKAIQKAAQYFSIKQIKPQNPPQFVLDWLAKGFDKKTLNREQLTRLISYVIDDFIPNYPPLKDRSGRVAFDFSFRNPIGYGSWKEFTDHIASMAYRITFENIPDATIANLVEEGRLCLFLLWNKDFSKASSGRPNLHTQYWNAVFSPENLRDAIIQLNGEAELFFRPKSIREPFRHKVGEKMVNRRGRDGSPIPESIHGELFRHVNGSPEPLSAAARAWLSSGNLVVKDVAHEIVKDARFAEDKFSFHVPITINFKQPDAPARFNDQVREFLRANPDVNVIGIDRGERNLLYLALVDRKGNLLEQRSFNVVSQLRRDGVPVCTDYQAKLVQSEKDRAEARASWAEIGAIKDLKEGYLSAVVHEIAKMMVERNAVVVLEDLNRGFKRGRFRIERQVYQKFEKALIDKLNYLVFKDRGMAEPGGTLRGYQLTNAFESFEAIGKHKQTGFLFYVPAGYTSKIDPTTGFTNLFNTKKCANAAGVRDFFAAFDSIRWDAARHAFAFSFDYANFKTSQESHRTQWTVFSADRRLVFDKDAKSEKEINPTAIILAALAARGIAVADGFDLKALLLATEPSKANAAFFRSVFYAFDRTLQMRNSSADGDHIQSPVLNGRGEFFDSRKADPRLPVDADANGAYHIALKGLQLLEENLAAKTSDLKIEHKAWFRFAQELAARKFRQA